MWQHVLAQIDCKLCKLCGESVSEVSEIQLEHCFLLCPAISDLREAELTRLTVEDVKYPEPHEFRRVLAFVASVLERHRWQADLEKAESSDQERDEREKNEKYETKQKEKNTIEEKNRIAEGQQRHTPQAPQPLISTASTAQQKEQDSKTLHLVLYPKGPEKYDDSPLGRFREKILQEVAANRVTIIVAPTGCGKSTRSLD